MWFATADRNRYLPRPPFSSAMLWLGSHSYALYLLHVPVYVATREIGFRLGQVTGEAPAGFGHAEAFILGGVLATLAFAELTFRFVEVPLRRYGRRIADLREAPGP